ncbi:FG-GAP repeat protein [Thalassoglobus neptunius]|uniref:FG-GAP repeat protein n=1 Tax=Thalassoglobus neptunius TaxID=1938619 RepID=A0A5C5WQW0_9PLAN|nr:VCBS repeat-containing protein [Thalassoglobus neptunius]TWT52182.1 FG-GAP repeat protein [Thalassoglobus neptunius]
MFKTAAVLAGFFVSIQFGFAEESVWVRHTIDNTSRGADGIRVADFNSDGHLDLVTGWEEGGQIRVYTNPGPKASRSSWPFSIAGHVASPEDAVFADLDGDGQMEVVSCCEGKNRSVYFHWQKEQSWETVAVPALESQGLWMFCAPMDIDHQHGVDLVIGAKGANAQLGWLQSPSDPRQTAEWKWNPLTQVGWIMSIEVTDMDGDGDEDILYTDRKLSRRGLHWLEYQQSDSGSPQWTRHTVGGTDREVMFLSQGDLNHDGKTDIAVAVKNGPITWYERADDSGQNWIEHEIAMPSDAGTGKGIAILDVDLDGLNDLVFSCEHSGEKRGLEWLKRDNVMSDEWVFKDIAGLEDGVKFDLLQSIDLDHDGDLDQLTCEERDNLGVIWYENPTISE